MDLLDKFAVHRERQHALGRVLDPPREPLAYPAEVDLGRPVVVGVVLQAAVETGFNEFRIICFAHELVAHA